MKPINATRWLIAAAMATTLVLSACGGSSSDAPETRDTAYGKVQGVDDGAKSGTYYWKGIPFAQAPAGALRWKAPVAPTAWKDTLQATQFGASCIQNPRMYSPGNANTFDASVGDNILSGHTPGSEDCLSLNIWRPATKEKNLPVIVFIYGGSNITGYSGDPLYDGAALAKKANAVVVSANYRLGQLGFFRHPALRDTAVDPTLTPEDQSGNYAVLDIIAALTFVQGNNGTIPALNPVATYEALSNMLLMKLLIDDGTAADVAGATAWVQSHSNAEIAAYLRGKPASTILKVGLKTVGGLPNTTASGPIPEGTVVPTDPIAAILAGDYVKVPVMSGMTNHEGKLLSSFLPLVGHPVGIKLPDAQLFPILFDAGKAKAATFHDIVNPAYADGAAYDVAIADLDAKFFVALRDNFMDALATQTPNQLWSYRFDWKQEPAPWNDVYGAAHAFDLAFLFGNFGPSLYSNVIVSDANKAGRLALSDAMMSTLAAFARSGNPNTGALGVNWPNWPNVLLFDATLAAKQISVQ